MFTKSSKAHNAFKKSPKNTSKKTIKGRKGDRRKRRKISKQFIEKSMLATVRDTKNGGAGDTDFDDYITLVDDVYYRVKYNVTLREDGLVSLTPVQDLISAVGCSYLGDTASIRIEFAQDIDDVQDLFPIGAVLAVDSSIFGPCVLSDAEAPSNDDFLDGILTIESVTGNSKEAVVSGVAGSFLNMFQRGSILIQRLNSTDVEVSEEGSRQLVVKSFGIRKVIIQIPPLLRIEANAEIIVDAGVDVLRKDWDFSDGFFDFSVKFFFEAQVDVDAELFLGKGTVSAIEKCTEYLPAVPLFVLPVLGWFGLLIPALKAQATFKNEFCGSLQWVMGVQLGLSASYTKTTGRSETEYYFYYQEGLGPADYGTNVLLEPIPNSTGSLLPLDDLFDPNILFAAEVNVGPKASLKLELSTLGNLGFELPIQLNTKAQILFPRPFKPRTLADQDLYLKDFTDWDQDGQDCFDCHHFEMDVVLFSQLQFVVNFKVLDIELASVNFDIGPGFELPLIKGCLLANTDVTCVDTCCGDALGDGACSVDTAIEPPKGSCPETENSVENPIRDFIGGGGEFPDFGDFPLVRKERVESTSCF
jgi:hypothetical protein